jgi:hypothetical protein
MRTIIGQVVGRYRIEAMLAQGGVGVVYKAEDNHRSPGGRSRFLAACYRSALGTHSGSILNTLDADELHKAMQVEKEDVSLWKILTGLMSKETQLVVALGVNLMNMIGKALLRRSA